MNTRLLPMLMAVVFVTANIYSASAFPTKPQEELQAVQKERARSWKAMNVEALMAAYAPDYKGQSLDGKTLNRAATKKAISDLFTSLASKHQKYTLVVFTVKAVKEIQKNTLRVNVEQVFSFDKLRIMDQRDLVKETVNVEQTWQKVGGHWMLKQSRVVKDGPKSGSGASSEPTSKGTGAVSTPSSKGIHH